MCLDTVFSGVRAVRCKPGTKEIVQGSPAVDPTEAVNRAGINGTGGLVIVDFDAKNGASELDLQRAFPGVLDSPTLVVSTATKGCCHYVYRWPGTLPVRAGDSSVTLVPGVEVPARYMMYGSSVNGVTYTVLRDEPVAELPTDLYAVLVADWQQLERSTPVTGLSLTQQEREARAFELLKGFGQYEAGKTNEKFLEVAFPVLQLLGVERGALELEAAWPSATDSEAEVRARVSSAVASYSTEADPSSTGARYSPTRARVLLNLENTARYGVWKGRSAPNDRRVLLAVLERASRVNELVVSYPAETLANRVGIKPSSVRESLERLSTAGWLHWMPKHSLVALTSSELVRLLVKGNSPTKGSSTGCGYSPFQSQEATSFLHPVDEVWRAPGLRARHAHLFDLVDAGVNVRSSLVARSGASKATVSETVCSLQEHGLIVENAGVLEVAPTASSVVATLRQQASETYASVRAGIESDHRRLEAFRNERRLENQQRLENAYRRRELEETAPV